MKHSLKTTQTLKVSPVSPLTRDFELKNQLADLDMAEKEALVNLHWTLDQYENADFYDLQRVLGAKDKDNRVVDPLSLI